MADRASRVPHPASRIPRSTSRIPRRRALALGGTALAAVALSAGAGARAARAVAADTLRFTLANGLVVVAEERPSSSLAVVQLTARAGTRDDTIPGLGDLTSRLMFSGTATRPSSVELNRPVSLVGGSAGRQVAPEESLFRAVLPWREAEAGFDLLADIVANPLFDPARLAAQKELATQELARLRANPESRVARIYQEVMFAGTSLANSRLGTPETIDAITLDDVRGVYDRFWGASNLVLTVVGRVPPATVRALAERLFGGLPEGTRNQRPSVRVQPPVTPQVVRDELGEAQVQYRLGTIAPGLGNPDRFPMRVMNAIVGGGATGRMFRELRTDRGLVYSAYSAFIDYTDAGTWFAWGAVEPGNLSPALDLVRAEVRRIRDAEPPAAEFADAVSALTGSLILERESAEAQAAALADIEVLGELPTEAIVARLRAVTPSDVQRVAQTWLTLESSVLATVGPRGHG